MAKTQFLKCRTSDRTIFGQQKTNKISRKSAVTCSTETAFAKIFNDLLLAADQGQVSALCLLDLTSAFDCVDHTLLLTRLQRSFGVQVRLSGVVYVVSVRSKLLRGHQRCRLSCNPYHVFGPTGPSFWPVVILYVADLADIAAQYNLTLHAFADDNQLYIHCKPENVQSAVTSVQQCYCYWAVDGRQSTQT